MNCLRNTGSLLSQIMLRWKAQRLVQDLSLIRGSTHIRPAFRPQPTSRRSFVLRWYHEPRKATAATAIALSATVMAALNRFDREIVPCTYRSHLVVLSHQEERKHSDAAFAEHKAELVGKNLVVDPRDPRYARVRLIAERIIHAAHRGLGIYDSNDAPMLRVTDKRRKWGKAPPHTGHLRGLNWEVFLTKNDQPDAGIMPSGPIMVSTGFLDWFKTDDEIAAVLAHELGHVIARHHVDINNIALLPKFLHNFFSRRMEIEADYIGILLLGAAGFHPQWALVALEKRAKHEGSVLGNIFVDHPKPENQLRLLSEAKTMKEALELYREAIAMDKVTDRYFRDLKELVRIDRTFKDKEAHTHGLKKTELGLSSFATEILSMVQERDAKAEKERQTISKALTKTSKECEGSLKTEYTKFEATHDKFCKDKAAHVKNFKDPASVKRIQQLHSCLNARNLKQGHKIADAEVSLKKMKQGNKSISMVRKAFAPFLGRDDGRP